MKKNMIYPATANKIYIDIPTAIMGTASTRPITINICVLSIGINSGWRAAPSINLAPRIPIPTAAPSAPRPIKIDPAKNNGLPDKLVPKTDKIAYKSEQVVWNDYEFTIDNLPTFRNFSIKLVGTGTNQAQPPRVKDLRVIALA